MRTYPVDSVFLYLLHRTRGTFDVPTDRESFLRTMEQVGNKLKLETSIAYWESDDRFYIDAGGPHCNIDVCCTKGMHLIIGEWLAEQNSASESYLIKAKWQFEQQ